VTSNNYNHIVFYDGVCGLCSGVVARLLRWDKHHRLSFAALQGQTAARLRITSSGDLESMVYLADGKRYTASEGVIRAMAAMGGGWKFVLVLLVFPRFLRDAVYNWVGRNRYRWFGKLPACRIPSPDERKYFFD
jgi:predicted DCC family thiol-disulfide oxidoreductase YuxK